MIKKKLLLLALGLVFFNSAYSEQTGDCTAGTDNCEQNSLNTSNNTTTNNTNNNISSGGLTNQNTNINTSNSTSNSTSNNTSNSTTNNTSVSTNNNINQNSSSVNTVATTTSVATNNSTVSSTTTSDVTQNVNSVSTSKIENQSSSIAQNTNINQSTSESKVETENRNINQTQAENRNTNINKSDSTQVIRQEIKSKTPVASAVAPSVLSYSQDICISGVSGGFQNQIFGLSGGAGVVDENCVLLKLSRALHSQGMKVASISILCSQKVVFTSMMQAGTPCPYFGKVGEEARKAWEENKEDRPDYEDLKANYIRKCKGKKNSKGIRKSKRTCAKEFRNS